MVLSRMDAGYFSRWKLSSRQQRASSYVLHGRLDVDVEISTCKGNVMNNTPKVNLVIG